MKNIFLLLFLSSAVSYMANAQREAVNWFFGDGAGIRFEADESITPTIGSLNTDEGCSSISDSDGNLLFYTDGSFVYDRNGLLMQNGSGLFGDPSSTQSGLIVPNPQFDNIFYIFTVDTINGTDPSTDQGFSYSIVDMSLNGGLGAVTQKNTLLLEDSSEKISAVLSDCQSAEIWVITYAASNAQTPNLTPSNNNFNTFYAFKVTAAGVSNTPVISGPFTGANDPRGYLKLSPDGTKLACANATSGLFLYDFDSEFGTVSNEQRITISFSPPNPSKRQDPYGLEFSPNNQFLYVSAAYNPSQDEFDNASAQYSSLLQYDVTAANIQATQIVLDDRIMYRAALQLGPDGKIYRTASATYQQGLPYLTYINHPNEEGIACDYNHDINRIQLNRNSRQGLPPFIASFFVETIDIINQPNITNNQLPLCNGDTYTLSAAFEPDATYTWFFNDVEQPTPPIHNEFEVTQNGIYKVIIESNNGQCETSEGIAEVNYFSNPEAFALPANNASLVVCDDDGTNDGIFRFTDFDAVNAAILGPNQNPLDFTLKYYLSFEDANNGRDEITFPYTNAFNNQQIFVRVENASNRNCFTTTDTTTGEILSFILEVYDAPTIARLDHIESCDTYGDPADGVINLTLTDFNADILGANQDAADFTISYHSSLNAAEAGNNPLPENYQNAPFNDELFVRIENNLNPDCYVTDNLAITINLTPLAIDASIVQCDEDGVPDGQTVFNITQLDDTVTGSDPNTSVTYYENMTNAMAEIDAIDATNYSNTNNPQTLVARVTNTTTGCYSFSNITIETSTTTANDAYLGVCDTDGEEDGFAVFDLSQANAAVLEGLPSGLDLEYYETLDDALLEINPLPTNFTNTEAFNQTIFVRVENQNNCFGINEVMLEVLGLPNVETEFETLYCLNTFPETITLTGGVFDDIPNNYYYNWSTGETTKDILVNEPGVYTVTVTSVFGCSKERTITVLASNTATITDIEVTDAATNNTVTIITNGEGDYEYAINDPLGPYQTSHTFENVLPGIYTVYVRDNLGCGITEEMFSVIGFPKFFTPNGDNQNDFWQVRGISNQFQPNSTVIIYNKYGKLMAELDPTGSGWDGTYNGNPMPSDDYWFSVTLQDGRQFSSHFSLKR